MEVNSMIKLNSGICSAVNDTVERILLILDHAGTAKAGRWRFTVNRVNVAATAAHKHPFNAHYFCVSAVGTLHPVFIPGARIKAIPRNYMDHITAAKS